MSRTNATTTVVIITDADGNTAIGKDMEGAVQAYTDEIGNLEECGGYTVTTLTVHTIGPVCVEAEVTQPDEPEPTVHVEFKSN